MLSPSYQGKGYMREAVGAVLALAFEDLSLNRVELRIMEGNSASIRFAESMGFKFEGYSRKSLFLRGEYRTLCYYSMLASEYFDNRAGDKG